MAAAPTLAWLMCCAVAVSLGGGVPVHEAGGAAGAQPSQSQVDTAALVLHHAGSTNEDGALYLAREYTLKLDKDASERMLATDARRATMDAVAPDLLLALERIHDAEDAPETQLADDGAAVTLRMGDRQWHASSADNKDRWPLFERSSWTGGWATSAWNPDAPQTDADTAFDWRRLQVGGAGIIMTINYVVACPASCDAISAQLAELTLDPVAGALHAQNIINAINTVAAAQGFGNAVVLSTAAQVAATIGVPQMVTITLPPAPVTVQGVDCEGQWTNCTALCEPAADRVWSEAVAQSGTGAACPATIDVAALDGGPADCMPGDGECPQCPAVFLGPGIGFANIMAYHDTDGDCTVDMNELAALCAIRFAECMSFLQSSEAPEPEPEPEPEPGCELIYLGPDIGMANVMEYHDSDGSCTLSMAELGVLCSLHFAECMSFLNSPPPAGQDGATTAVTQIATGSLGTTVQLTYTLTAEKANVYAMAGRANAPLAIPSAFQVDAPFGTNTGGVSPAFFAVMADSEFDSWLTVGIADGSNPTALSSIGIDFTSWTATAGITNTNGAIFWMNPASGPAGTTPIVMAQITNSGTGTATAFLQGKSATGDDWNDATATWSW